jgi:hypothetical protein
MSKKTDKNRENTIMRKLLPLVLAVLLLLPGCGQKPLFGVSTNEDNSISVTAEKGPKDCMGIGYLTVVEGEEVVVDANFNQNGKIRLRFMAGVLGSEEFPNEPAFEAEISGADSMRFRADPGEYTVAVIALSKVSGSALIHSESSEGEEAGISEDDAITADQEMSALGYTPDSLVGSWEEKIAGRGNIEITKRGDERYDVRIHWGAGATEMHFWQMTASPAGSNTLRYEDCRYSVITLPEDETGEDTETVQYENGTGSFTLLSTNELTWQDDTGHAGDNVLFISAA